MKTWLFINTCWAHKENYKRLPELVKQKHIFTILEITTTKIMLAGCYPGEHLTILKSQIIFAKVVNEKLYKIWMEIQFLRMIVIQREEGFFSQNNVIDKVDEISSIKSILCNDKYITLLLLWRDVNSRLDVKSVVFFGTWWLHYNWVIFEKRGVK